jgi:hypothetical protein
VGCAWTARRYGPVRESSRECVDPRLTVLHYLAAVTEDDFLRTLPLADRLRIAAVDLATTGAPQVAAVWEAAQELGAGGLSLGGPTVTVGA